MAGVGFLIVRSLVNPTAAFSHTVQILPDKNGSTSDPDAALMNKLKKEGYTYNDHIVNILLLGLDSSEQREEESMGWRSDVIIIAAIDTQKKTIKLISIPRDTYTLVNKVDKNGKITSSDKNKINAAFAFGGGPTKYSYPNSVAAVRHLLYGIPIHGYAGVDMDGFTKLIDSLGGIKLEITDDLSKVDSNFPKKGTTATLNGAQALLYVRERHTTQGGDAGRARRQRELLAAILHTGQSKGMIPFAARCFTTLSGDVTTNLTMDQVTMLATIGVGVNLDNMEMVSLEGDLGRSESNASIFEPDEKKLKQLVIDTWMVKN
jgi:LCP family protein required for cell wall assembly